MERTPVSSSNVASVGYDPDSMTLEMEFLSGSVYQYFQVPEFEYQNLIAADSVGKYFHQNIRNVYQYAQV